MTYKVYDSRTGKDITNDYIWVILPDGELKYVYYSDLIELPYAYYTIKA